MQPKIMEPLMLSLIYRLKDFITPAIALWLLASVRLEAGCGGGAGEEGGGATLRFSAVPVPGVGVGGSSGS
eukprot:COSAG02_NODE_24229_length_694_cov_1.146218_1_plen_71_part_10